VTIFPLTPRFSEVPVACKVATAFSGFSGTVKKLLKRLQTLALAFRTPLKQGVNDTHSGR